MKKFKSSTTQFTPLIYRITPVKLISCWFTKLFLYNNLSNVDLYTSLIASFFQLICLQQLYYHSKATHQNGQLVSVGIELNASKGLGEFILDIYIVMCMSQVLSLINTLFWLILLLIPLGSFYYFWIYVIWPWATTPSIDSSSYVSEKSKQKRERQLKRNENRKYYS
ncbi:Transmembrane protein [Intoshia linei]|uniref:Transmembrane protein 208 n=1 Tax=Intoshia linei TaxID=1819745 RepID=A0A177AQ89_9BILA|nr:Transmembrane protein [Intoshia linei]